MFIPVSFALLDGVTCTTIILNETFDYVNDTFDNHGWDITNSGCGFINYPLNDSLNATGYYGFNGTTSCIEAGHYDSLRYDFTPPIGANTSNLFYLEMDYWIFTDTGTGTNGFYATINNETAPYESVQFYPYSHSLGGGRVYSNWNSVFFDYSSSFKTGTLKILVDFTDGTLDYYDNNDKQITNYDITADYNNIRMLHLYFNTFGSQTFYAGVDNVLVCEGDNVNTSATGCQFPILFCDTFNYASSLYDTGGWDVYKSDDSLDTTFTPTDNVMIFNDSSPYRIVQPDQGVFPVNLELPQTGVGSAFLKTSSYAPKFTNEWEFYINGSYDSNEYVNFFTTDNAFHKCWDLKVENAGLEESYLFYYNFSTSSYINLTTINPNETYKLKVVSHFATPNQTGSGIYYFNTSYDYSFVYLYVNSSRKTDIYEMQIPFNCQTIRKFEAVTKQDNIRYGMDNYYFYVGTDKDVSTYYEDLIPLEPQDFDEDWGEQEGQPQDVDLTIRSIWGDMGLHSARSKAIAGMFFLIMFSIVFVVTLSLKTNLSVGGIVGSLAIIDLFWIILMVYIGLLSTWLIVLIVLIMLVIGFVLLIFSKQ